MHKHDKKKANRPSSVSVANDSKATVGFQPPALDLKGGETVAATSVDKNDILADIPGIVSDVYAAMNRKGTDELALIHALGRLHNNQERIDEFKKVYLKEYGEDVIVVIESELNDGWGTNEEYLVLVKKLLNLAVEDNFKKKVVESETKVKVTNALNVRSTPKIEKGNVVRKVKNGEVVIALEKKDGWMRIGENEWISEKHTETTETEKIEIDQEKIDGVAASIHAAGSTSGVDELAIFNALASLNSNPDLIDRVKESFLKKYGVGLTEFLTEKLPNNFLQGDQKGVAETLAKGKSYKTDLDKLMEKERLTPEEITKARELIQEVTDETKRGDYFMQLQWKVNFNNQRDSTVESGGKAVEGNGGGICNLTALAMCLEYLGISNPKPEMQYEDALELIRQEQGFAARTGAGWEQVAGHLGATVEFIIARGAGSTHDKTWWEGNVGAAMRSGKSVIFSSNGHILRMQSMDDKGVYVDDPYGKLDIKKTAEGDFKKRKWDTLNERGETGGKWNEGEDNLWEWQYVTKYPMWWLAAISK